MSLETLPVSFPLANNSIQTAAEQTKALAGIGLPAWHTCDHRSSLVSSRQTDPVSSWNAFI